MAGCTVALGEIGTRDLIVCSSAWRRAWKKKKRRWPGASPKRRHAVIVPRARRAPAAHPGRARPARRGVRAFDAAGASSRVRPRRRRRPRLAARASRAVRLGRTVIRGGPPRDHLARRDAILPDDVPPARVHVAARGGMEKRSRLRTTRTSRRSWRRSAAHADPARVHARRPPRGHLRSVSSPPRPPPPPPPTDRPADGPTASGASTRRTTPPTGSGASRAGTTSRARSASSGARPSGGWSCTPRTSRTPTSSPRRRCASTSDTPTRPRRER